MAKPKLALIPAAQGTSLYSVLPSSGVGDFDFTRSGSATRINSQGLIETVASGVSRLNYPMIDGVVKGCPHHILEPQRTNLVQYSEDFSQSYWGKSNSSIVSNQIISPDGTLNADKLIESSASGVHLLVNTSVSTDGSVTGSIYAKYLSRYLRLTLHDSTNPNEWYSVIYDLENGIIYDSLAKTVTVFDSKIEQMPNGYYRCVITADLGVNSSTLFYVQTSNGAAIVLGDDRGRGQYQGDGTSGIYIFGSQLEEGSYATSYIPNYGTAAGVTRSAETANGSGDASTFNSEQGVLMVEASDLDNGGGGVISINTGNNTQKIFLYLLNNTTIRYYAQGSGGFISNDISIPSSSNFNKIAFKYKTSDFGVWINGFELSTNTSAITFSNLSSLDFYNPYLGGTENFYGKTKQLQYFDTALTDSELETLTSWVSFEDMAISQQYSLY